MDDRIACSLDATDARSQIDEWRAVFGEAVGSVERTGPNRVSIRLKREAAAGSLVALAQREVACCPFFTFDVEIGSEGTTFIVSVPSEATSILDDFATLAGGSSVSAERQATPVERSARERSVRGRAPETRSRTA